MESEMPRPHGHHGEGHRHPIVGLPSGVNPSTSKGGSDHEHHHEKKSVLKKVKAKAKKIKETLTKHGQDYPHNDQNHDEGEDGDGDGEEMEEGPEVRTHSAPMYLSAAPLGSNPPPTLAAEDLYGSKYTDPPTRPFGQWLEENSGQPGGAALGVADHVPENRHVAFSRGTHGREETTGKPKINTGTTAALEEDPHAPKNKPEVSNYQSKVTNPTGAGGEEIGVTPILRSFNKMNVQEDKPDQTELKRFDGTTTENMPRDTLVTKQPMELSAYTEKISSATSAVVDKAITARNVVSTKLGYGGNGDISSWNGREGEEGSKSGSVAAAEYGHKIAVTVTEKLAPVREKVAAMGSLVVSKVEGPVTEEEEEEEERGGVKGQDKEVSVKEYLGEKLRPSSEDKALSDAISNALHKKPTQGPENATGAAGGSRF